MNQALVDIANCTIFTLPNAIFLLVQILVKREESFMYPTLATTLILSATSSVLLFVIIAVERFISLYNPIWHRTNIYARRIWKTIVVAWVISLLVAGIVPITFLPSSVDEANHQMFIYVLIYVPILISWYPNGNDYNFAYLVVYIGL